MAFQVGLCSILFVTRLIAERTNQHVPHVHFHIIPKPNETEGLIIGEQNWPQAKPENDVLAATCAKMKQRL
jgi:diadenosine tetraphosphate (Ap4A) HIT family hydrolase